MSSANSFSVCLLLLGLTSTHVCALSDTEGDTESEADTEADTEGELVGSIGDTFDSDALLCGLQGAKGATRAKRCTQLCKNAISEVEQPPFPADFFGGRDADERQAGEFSTGKGEAILDVEVLADGSVKVKSVNESFVYPMHMPAYFSCYARSKWPLFNAWVVDPELLAGKKQIRAGSFGVPSRDSEEYKSMHKHISDEYLRSADVKGVWSDYFGYDQGHWAPDAPFRQEKQLVESTYYYINVSPQTSCLNRGNWEGLEASVREFTVAQERRHSVMAGPLEFLPEVFYQDPDEQIQESLQEGWVNLLEMWRVASAVLMDGSDGKDPHWIEAMPSRTEPQRCIMRGHDSDSTKLAKFLELARLPACNSRELAKDLHSASLFLMTEAGKSETRRGVRVPLGYWKVVSWTEGPKKDPKQRYCCWLFDQTDNVRVSGPQCKAMVKSHGAPVLPSGLSYAGDEVCQSLFTPSPKKSVECDFANRGIGWRGAYLLRELAVTAELAAAA